METTEDVLKGAMLLEERGKAFYEHAAQEAQSPGVREVFTILAEEEERHRQYLARALADFLKTGNVGAVELGQGPVDVTKAVLTPEVVAGISAAGFEAAAIYAGMALEDRAVSFYREKAQGAPQALASLYESLARWEQTHLDLLTSLNEDLRLRIWYDRRFWPVL